MKQNCFQLEINFFEQKQGIAMGNPITPFLDKLFMSMFEMDFKDRRDYFQEVVEKVSR